MHIVCRVLPLVALFSSSLGSQATLLEADQGNWTVEGCILVRMAAQVTMSMAWLGEGRGGGRLLDFAHNSLFRFSSNQT